MASEEFLVCLPENESIRVDRFVAALGMFNRSQIAKRSVRIKDAYGVNLKHSKRLKNGDVVVIEWHSPPAPGIDAEPIHLDIIFEDENCVVINKQRGVVVHPALGNMHGTLVQGLLHRYSGIDRQFGGDRVRPGIVHRLDKDTSGVMIVAKNIPSSEHLSAQFRAREVGKTYLAICRGRPPSSRGEIDDSIGRDPRNRKKFTVGVRNSKPAVTRYRLLDESGKYSLLQIEMLTGRTHQIRVHLCSIACPILGDPVYARRDSIVGDCGLMLHAWKLSVDLLCHGAREFQAEPPREFAGMLDRLGIDFHAVPWA